MHRKARSRVGALLESINEAEYLRVFAAMEQDRVDGLVVSDGADHFPYRQLIIDLVARSRVNGRNALPYFVELGGLIASGIDCQGFDQYCSDRILDRRRPGRGGIGCNLSPSRRQSYRCLRSQHCGDR
jgi:hypothetical protein